MSAIALITRRLEELSKELSEELSEPYSVVLELHLNSAKDGDRQEIKVNVIEYQVWVVNSITVRIDIDAPITETLTYVKNKFRFAVKLDQYRKSKAYTVKDIIKKLEDEDDQKAWFCKKNSLLCTLMDNGCFKSYRLNGTAEYTEDEYQNEIRKNLLHSTPIDFNIFDYYEEFKDYIRKFNTEITIWEHDYDNDPLDEGDEFHFSVENGLGCMSELDVKSFGTLFGFLNWLEIRKEMKK